MTPIDFCFLNPKSIVNLSRVHPDLCAVVALTAKNLGAGSFTVTEGVRSLERQKQLCLAGASKTLNSRHLLDGNGVGHAVDLAVIVMGEIRWDWPLYTKLAESVKVAAAQLNVPIEWGGDWTKFKDGPHFQLPWKNYP